MNPKKLAVALASLALCNLACADDVPVYQGNELIVTANRFPEQQSAVPANVIVITQKDIQQSSATSLPEIISQFTGAHVFSTDGTTSGESIDFRGFGMTGNQNTLVLVDGQRLNTPELTAPNWSLVPLSAIERIEVIRGSGAVLYGEGASGGVINIITKKSAGNNGSAQVAAGNYRTGDIQVQENVASDYARMRVNAEDYTSGHYRLNNQERRKNMDADLRFQAGNGDLFFKLGAERQNLRYPGNRQVIPGTGVNQFVSDPRGTSTPNDYSTLDDGRLSFGADQQTVLGAFAGELSYREKHSTSYFQGSASYQEANLRVLSFTPRLKNDYTLLGYKGNIVTGLDLSKWDYGNPQTDKPSDIASPTANVQASQKNQAIYALSTTNLSASTILTAGARLQHADYHSIDITHPSAFDYKSFTPHAYDLGLRQNLTPTTSVYGKIGQSYRLATVNEIFNAYGGPGFTSSVAILAPQTSKDRQIGVDYAHDHTTLHGDVYEMNLENELHYNPYSFQNINLPPTRRQGLELSGSEKLDHHLTLFANYTYTVAKFRSGAFGGNGISGNDVPMVPRHVANVGATWQLAPHTRLSGNLAYVGKQRFDNDQSNTFQKMPSYTLVDLKLVHETKKWETSIAVNNLFDRQYYGYGVRSTSASGNYNVYPGYGRNVLASATYEF